MVRVALAAIVGVFVLAGSMSAQYPELNELQVAKEAKRKAQQNFTAEMTAAQQLREAGKTEQASVALDQALRRYEAVTRQLHEQIRAMRSEVVPLKSCVLPDETSHPVDATVTFQGQALRCVIVLDHDLRPSDVAWSPSSAQE
jgi:hypothetical protein